MFRLTCIMLALFLYGIASSQKAVSKEIQTLTSAGVEFQKADLFNFRTDDLRSQDLNLEGLKKGTILSLDLETIQRLLKEDMEFISIPIPVSGRSQINLTLKRHEIFAPDFKVFTSDNSDTALEYSPGIHYKGIVDGDPNSLVAVSFFHDQVIGLIATDEGNLTIGKIIGDAEGRHIFYNDRDLEEFFPIICSTADDGVGYTKEQLEPQMHNRDINDCLRVYIEVNDDIVTAKGGAIPATDYITAILNQCIVIYTNDQINMVVSEIKVWTTPSPYVGGSAGQMLYYFNLNTDLFNGDLAQLLSFDSLFGGQANSLNGLCASSPDQSKCVSGMRHNYFNVPLYSNPVDNITHEFGHLLGSNHTHACVWNGNNTKIDGCGGAGGCDGGIIPPNGGTIMSYCYPSTGSFKNFSLGFGPQPGTLIRNNINTASNCLSPCGQPVAYCESSGAAGTGEYIDKVVLANINNLSGNNNGYANFAAQSADLNAGNTYTLTLTPKFSGGNNTKYWRIYIDYNQDFDWYDDGECVAQGTANNIVSYTFTVPPSTPSLSTRMRVSMKLTGYALFCGSFAVGEVEDYTIVVTGTTPTCSDGIQNQGETGIDCGGPCSPCPPAPSCIDAIQNQGETGIDCGGACPACPVGDSTILLGSYFETGLDSWIDGGPDVARVISANSYEGSYSIQLADNSGAQSAMTSPVFNLSDAVGLHITFHFKAVSMEAGEDFWVQYKNGSGNWTTIGSFVAGTHFTNGNFYSATATVPGFVPTSAGSLRIQCDASDNNDEIYIDAVTIVKLNGLELIESGVTIQKVERPGVILEGTLQTDEGSLLAYYPNPTNGMLTMELSSPASVNMSFQVLSLTGQSWLTKKAEPEKVIQQMDVYDLPQGLYLLQLLSEDHVISIVKFVKN